MATLTLQPDESTGIDTYIQSGTPTFNFGTSGSWGADSPQMKAMIRFDISGLIPAGATIQSATLRLYASAAFGSTTYSIHRSLVDWFEGASNGAVPGAGVNASTWNLRNANGAVAWSGGAGGAAGTEYASSATASVVIPSNTFGDKDFNVLADIQAFYAGTQVNRGWWFVSSNDWWNGVSSNGSAAVRPRLIITYKIVGQMHGTAAGTSTVTGTLDIQDFPPLILQPNPTDGIDTRILQELPTSNYGIGTLLSTGWSGTNIRRAMIKFDLSAIPPGSVIQRAAVFMYYETSGSAAISNDIGIHRSLVEWFEGASNAAVPGAGVNASTYNHRNANGSVAWAGGAGGQVGTEWLATPSDSNTIVNTAGFQEWEVTQDVQDFVDGTYSNYGWWFIGTGPMSGAANSKVLLPSDHVTVPSRRPFMVIEYVDVANEISGSAAGTSTVTGTLRGIARMHGTAAGISVVEGILVSNAAAAVAEGTSTVTGTLTAIGYMRGTAAGTSTATARIRAKGRLHGISAGDSVVSGAGSFNGMLRGSAHGVAVVTGTMWGKATGKRALEICDSTPLLYITDGSYLSNGQLDMLDLLDVRNGFLLKDWNPTLAQYKGGGYFSDSALGQGRRLSRRVFENAIEVMSLVLRSDNQNRAIEYLREYLRWQELAADYWTSDWMTRPVYMVARSPKETQARYAIIHVMSMPSITNPYAQPFFVSGKPAMEDLALRIERDPWSDYPPGEYEAVPISSIRSYTVADWGASS